MLNFLTADEIDQYEPQRQSNGLLIIAGLAGADLLQLAVQAFPLPKRSVGTIELRHLNEPRKYAGNPTYDDLPITFNDFIEKDLAGVIENWFNQVHNHHNGKTGFARSYKKSATLRTFGPNGQWDRDWDVLGIWPSSFDPGDIDTTAEDLVRLQVTFTVDKATRGRSAGAGSITSD